MSHQARIYYETDFSSQIEMVAQVIRDHPRGISAKDGAGLLPAPSGKEEFPDGRFTARAGDLMREGRVYTSQGSGEKRYHYEASPIRQAQRKREFERDNHPLVKLTRKYKKAGLVTPEERVVLLGIYQKARQAGI